MPELPEVETVVRELRPRLLGRRILAVEAGRQRLRRRWSPAWKSVLVGQEVQTVRRRGKWIILELAGGACLLVHLGMTGQFFVTPATATRAAHTHLVFRLDHADDELRYRDIRRFGSATVWNSVAEVEAHFVQAGLGPEPFDLDTHYWRDRLAATARCLKAVLLDQRAVAGVGNIYADESLFQARLHPTRSGRDLRPTESDRLRRTLATVLNRAIKLRGATIRDYVGGSGLKGQFQEEFRVYGRTGQPCPRCRRPVECIRLAGRSTHFCGHCQPRT